MDRRLTMETIYQDIAARTHGNIFFDVDMQTGVLLSGSLKKGFRRLIGQIAVVGGQIDLVAPQGDAAFLMQ